MPHLLSICKTKRNVIDRIIEKSLYYEQNSRPCCTGENKEIISAFFEPSTRTRMSFSLAALQMGFSIADITQNMSSLEKGETLEDTLKSLGLLQPSILIIRSSCSIIDNIDSNTFPCPVINAGDGHHEHPSQAIIDLYTLLKFFNGSIVNKKITFCGDVQRSRVMRSSAQTFRMYGANVNVVCPKILLNKNIALKNEYEFFDEIADGIKDSDIIYVLRIQRERFKEIPYGKIIEEYSDKYMLSSKHLEAFCPHAKVMHPGPVNRNVEIDLDSFREEQLLINNQIICSIPVRKAILNYCVTQKNIFKT